MKWTDLSAPNVHKTRREHSEGYRWAAMVDPEANVMPSASNCCCGFFGLFGHILKVVFPNVSPVSVALEDAPVECYSCPLKMPATETGEMLGRTTFRTWPKSPKNPQQPLEPDRERLCKCLQDPLRVAQMPK